MVNVNRNDFTYLLQNPQGITKEQTIALEDITEQFPYFQSAQSLYLKGLKNLESFKYNQVLKKTAAHTTDRSILFEFITSETFTQNQISESIKHQEDRMLDIELIDIQEVKADDPIELENKLKAELKKAETILDPTLFKRKQQVVSTILEQVDATNDNLEINKPLPFTKEDTHSFTEWLKLSTVQPIDRSNSIEVKIKSKKEYSSKLIDTFLQNNPKLDPKQKSETNINLAKSFSKTPEALMTETLAKVYLQQKNYNKAIQAYKILILKNPEKSGFFADQIRAINNLIDINKEES